MKSKYIPLIKDNVSNNEFASIPNIVKDELCKNFDSIVANLNDVKLSLEANNIDLIKLNMHKLNNSNILFKSALDK